LPVADFHRNRKTTPMSVKQMTPLQLQQKLAQQDHQLVLLDVREEFEFRWAKIAGSMLIPLNQIEERINELDKQQEIVVICHHGIRSQHAADFLDYCGFANIANLQGGIDAWSCQCDPHVPRY
jgi:rhodanese-related sulfurtransferase